LFAGKVAVDTRRNKSASKPLVSIITPSFNQCGFIRATIESVLGQNYPNIEYIVMDGGSTDNTVSVLKEYGDRLTWVSEKDEGQTDAINKGLYRSKGEIVAYLNSDDIYLPSAIQRVVDEFNSHPDVDFIYGDFHAIDQYGHILSKVKTIPFDPNILLYDANFISQPASFYRRRLIDEIGLFDADFQYLMDYEFFLRAARRKVKFRLVRQYLSAIRYHSGCKTLTGAAPWAEERRQLKFKYARPKVRQHPSAMKILSAIYRLKRYTLLLGRGQMDFLNFMLHRKQKQISQQDT
jgi:glycosyltransferase involved in cell wall biosynthesis